MYNLLIVDDEQIERDTIKFLINKYRFELNIFEAANGEEALECIRGNPIDILFTDIKMPFIDGLELASRVREHDSGIKIIIYSAYGEFDYAKKAIDLYVSGYILKPIEVEIFVSIMTKMILLCSSEQKQRETEELVAENKGIIVEYEKERYLLDLIYGTGSHMDIEQKLFSYGVDLEGKSKQIILFDFKDKFFDIHEEDFRIAMGEHIPCDYVYLNLNEFQSVILLLFKGNEMDKANLESLGEKLKDFVNLCFGTFVCIVAGKRVDDSMEISKSFNLMERMSEYKFFSSESLVLYQDGLPQSSNIMTERIDTLLNDYDKIVVHNDYAGMRTNTRLLFEYLQDNTFFSSIYIKYICCGIMKKIYKKKLKSDRYKQIVENIFAAEDMIRLANILFSAIDEIESGLSAHHQETGAVVVGKVVHIIESDYANDISLEYLAEKVFVSPSYLSYLFKKETGQNIVKYVMAYRLEKAAELLRNTPLKISEVCLKTGFSNLSYFCSLYKSYMGVTPAQYRRNEG